MQTTSRILLGGLTPKPERDLLCKWAEHAAANGGSFSVKHEWQESQWWVTYTINWPNGVTPQGVEQ